MEAQNIRDEIISQIETLSGSQLENVRDYLQILMEKETGPEDLLSKYLTFWCGGQVFGIAIQKVVQIIPTTKITPLPDSPQYIKGVLSLREEMIPVMDLRLRLGKEEAAYTSQTCTVIVNIHERSFGIIVDAVDHVELIGEDEIRQPPERSNRASNYLTGLTKREEVIMLLDLERLISEEELG